METLFSVISSILSPDDIAKFLCDKYQFTNVTCKLLKTGINHTYQVSADEGKFIFRIYSFGWRTVNEISEELKLLNILKQHGVSVSYPLTDTSRSYIQTLPAPEGERYAVLFSFANGNKIQTYNSET